MSRSRFDVRQVRMFGSPARYPQNPFPNQTIGELRQALNKLSAYGAERAQYEAIEKEIILREQEYAEYMSK